MGTMWTVLDQIGPKWTECEQGEPNNKNEWTN